MGWGSGGGAVSEAAAGGCRLMSRRWLPFDERSSGSKGCWRAHAQARVRPLQVVVEPPSLDHTARFGKAREPARVEALLAKAAVEALDRAVLHRLSGIDEEPLHTVLVGPAVEITAAQLGSVVHDQHVGIAAFTGNVLEHGGHPPAREREIDQDRRALARAVVLEIGGSEPTAVGQAVLDEVQGPALVGGDRAPGARHDTAFALLPAAATDGQLLLAIEPLHELVVGLPPLAAQEHVQPSVAEPAPLAGKGVQALAQAGMVACPPGFPLHHRARDPDQPASTAAGEPMLLLGDHHRLPPRRRRQQFFASRPLSAWLSSMLSASSCFSRRFSSSSARSRFEPPPLKWSTVRYVFGQDGGPRCRARDTRPRRLSPSCAR